MIRLLAVALALLTIAATAHRPLPTGFRAEQFTERDCRWAEGQIVMFSGRVTGRDGVGELYRLTLDGNPLTDRQWQALLPRDVWGRYDHGDLITVCGLLTLHDAAGERFATVHVAAK